MPSEINRRNFVKGSLLAGLALAAGESRAADPAPAGQAAAAPPQTKEEMPQGRLGELQISRLLLGGNLLTHFTHSRDLRYVYDLCAHYNTEAKILETLRIAEEHGINALVVHTVPKVLSILKKHRDQYGGKIKWIICTTAPIEPGLAAYRESVKQLADEGTEAIYVWGVQTDKLVRENQAALIGEAVEAIKLNDVPAGVGAHDLKVVETCEKLGVANDFYIKTFHHHTYPTAPRPEEIKGPYSEIPGYWCQDPQKTIDVMKSVKKPWIAFKVMAAGAIPPENAFRYSFQNGADFVLAGMFDYEIPEDARLIRKVLPDALKRVRPWYA